MTTRPTHHFPLTLIVPRIPSFVLGRRRSLSDDVARAFDTIHVKPRVIGSENIPTRDPFVLMMNHYHRPDIPAWWPAMGALKAIANRRAGHALGEARVLIASQWMNPGVLGKIFIQPFTRFMLDRVARVYNFLTIAPSALGNERIGERAHSIRYVITVAKQAKCENVPLVIAPEGADSPDGAMMHPPIGAGRFMLLLGATGLPFLPVGNFIENEIIVSRFGELFQLQAPAALKKDELDEWATHEVMQRIARLLPAELRGVYRTET
jgi:acyltransferase-like protein